MAVDRPVPPELETFWDKPLSTFATLEPEPIPDAQQERHRIYSLLLMAITLSQWNGNKYGPTGDYGAWRTNQVLAPLPAGGSVYENGSYLGHNICALAVDGLGRPIDFDFNHNNVFDSSVEHAESRLVRRVFALNQVFDPLSSPRPAATTSTAGRTSERSGRGAHHLFATALTERAITATPPDIGTIRGYATLLADVTIYTSLESCAQCSGIMTLASVKDIVYLQWDQGQFLVGNMMYKATANTNLGFTAPRPIRGDEFDFDYFDLLNTGNAAFSKAVTQQPFYTSPGFTSKTPSVTSFLCTDEAHAIYRSAADEFSALTRASHSDYVPPDAPPGTLSNQAALDQAHTFLDYVVALENRGTPHRV